MLSKKYDIGFTLIELLVLILVLSILVAIAYPNYQKYIRDTRLKEAELALAENIQFMMHFYQKKFSYKVNYKEWPHLPYTETKYFNIKFTQEAKDEKNDRFRIRARPKDFYAQYENRYLEVDYNLKLKICTQRENIIRCDIQ